MTAGPNKAHYCCCTPVVSVPEKRKKLHPSVQMVTTSHGKHGRSVKTYGYTRSSLHGHRHQNPCTSTDTYYYGRGAHTPTPGRHLTSEPEDIRQQTRHRQSQRVAPHSPLPGRTRVQQRRLQPRPGWKATKAIAGMTASRASNKHRTAKLNLQLLVTPQVERNKHHGLKTNREKKTMLLLPAAGAAKRGTLLLLLDGWLPPSLTVNAGTCLSRYTEVRADASSRVAPCVGYGGDFRHLYVHHRSFLEFPAVVL